MKVFTVYLLDSPVTPFLQPITHSAFLSAYYVPRAENTEMAEMQFLASRNNQSMGSTQVKCRGRVVFRARCAIPIQLTDVCEVPTMCKTHYQGYNSMFTFQMAPRRASWREQNETNNE